jgi:hypothetical protein
LCGRSWRCWRVAASHPPPRYTRSSQAISTTAHLRSPTHRALRCRTSVPPRGYRGEERP